jgi:predicted GTPase
MKISYLGKMLVATKESEKRRKKRQQCQAERLESLPDKNRNQHISSVENTTIYQQLTGMVQRKVRKTITQVGGSAWGWVHQELSGMAATDLGDVHM